MEFFLYAPCIFSSRDAWQVSQLDLPSVLLFFTQVETGDML